MKIKKLIAERFQAVRLIYRRSFFETDSFDTARKDTYERFPVRGRIYLKFRTAINRIIVEET